MMNNIGYVGPGEPKQWIETFGLGPCIGVQINSAELGYQLLMHSAGDRRWQAQEFLRFARIRKMIKTDADFLINDPVTIYASSYASAGDVVATYRGLKDFGCTNIEIVTNPHQDSIDVIINAKGERYYIKNAGSELSTLTKVDEAIMCARAFNSHSLYCVNTRETFNKQDYDHMMKRFPF